MRTPLLNLELSSPDLYRVNFEVNNLKRFPYLAFPHSTDAKISPKWPSFDGELMARYLTLLQRHPRSRSEERHETAQTDYYRVPLDSPTP